MTEPLETVALCKGTVALLACPPVPSGQAMQPGEVAWMWSGKGSTGRETEVVGGGCGLS